LGRLANPAPNQELAEWLEGQVAANRVVCVPEATDFEVRRNLLLHNLRESIASLDALKKSLLYLPITTRVMLKAAELWAIARRAGKPTADPKELDFDVILAAQALDVGGMVATDNIGHLGRFVTARRWNQISCM
jgi:predicted nucleic acid-binding protein